MIFALQKNISLPHWDFPPLFASFSLLLLAFILWMHPSGRSFVCNVDIKSALLLEKTVTSSEVIQYVFGYLNHKNEKWINVVIMFSINAYLISTMPGGEIKKYYFSHFLFTWIIIQIGIFTLFLMFHEIWPVRRLSPSLTLTPWHFLSDLLHNPLIKDRSTTSFPGGHAFVIILWACSLFSLKNTKCMTFIVWIVLLAFCLPRLFSGAHWVSDVIFSLCFSVFWYHLFASTPIYYYSMRKVAIFCSSLYNKK